MRWIALVLALGVAALLWDRGGRHARAPRETAAPPAEGEDRAVSTGVHDSDPDVRRAAFVALRSAGDDAVRTLEDLLREGDAEQRLLAARSLGKMERGRAALFAALDPGDPALCREIFAALEERRDSDPDAWALRMLDCGDKHLVLASLELLQARDPAVIDAVLGHLDPAGESELDCAALEALGYGPGGLDVIAACLSNKRLEWEAFRALERMGPAAAPVAPTIARILRNADAEFARERADAIARYGRVPDGLSFLSESRMRHAQYVLYEIGAAAIPAVRSMLGAESRGLRYAAFLVLAKSGEDALPTLRAAIHDPSPLARQTAMKALELQVEGDPEILSRCPDLLGDIACMRGNPDPAVRAGAVRFLVRFAGDRRVGADALEDADPGIVRAALIGLRLADRREPRLAERVVPLLAHVDPGVRLEAIQLLAKRHAEHPAGVSAIARSVGDEDDRVRDAAAEALLAIDAPAALAVAERLPGATSSERIAILEMSRQFKTVPGELRRAAEKMVGAPDPAVRLQAAISLATFGARDEAVVSILREGLREGDWDLRHAVEGALRRCGPAAASVIPDLLERARGDWDLDHWVDPELLAAVGARSVPVLLRALDTDRMLVEDTLRQIGAPAVPHLIRWREHREIVIPLLGSNAANVPEAREELWSIARGDPAPEMRVLALRALWESTYDARAIVPQLLKEIPNEGNGSILLREIGANAAFAIKEIRALYAKTRNYNLEVAIKEIEGR